MSNKTNIEEDIETWKEFINKHKEYGFYGIIKSEKIETLENILADRENYKNKYDSLVEKIKEEIALLEKEKLRLEVTLRRMTKKDYDRGLYDEYNYIKLKIQILKELLDTEKEKYQK